MGNKPSQSGAPAADATKEESVANAKKEEPVVSATDKAHSFIHFGCWNNLNVDKGGLEKVMTKLGSFLENSKENNAMPDFVLIAGDNYYPHKETGENETGEIKIKRVFKQRMIDGFQKLPDYEGLKYFMILGNHDLATNVAGKQTIRIEEGDTYEANGACTILQTQQELIPTLQAEVDYLFFKTVRLGNTLVVAFDSSAFLPNKEAESFLDCYNKFLKDRDFLKDRTLTIGDIRDHIRDEIIKALRDNSDIAHLIFCAHHPLVAQKHKKKKSKKSDKSDGNKKVEQIILTDEIRLFRENVLVPVHQMQKTSGGRMQNYYLCADTHLFQRGDVAIQIENESEPFLIRQYIVGTGGTVLDKEVPSDTSIEVVDSSLGKMVYTIQETKAQYGFLNCIIGDEPSFVFIEAAANEQAEVEADASMSTSVFDGSGGKRETRHHKRKRKGLTKTRTKRRYRKRTRLNI